MNLLGTPSLLPSTGVLVSSSLYQVKVGPGSRATPAVQRPNDCRVVQPRPETHMQPRPETQR
jgi:hypothetical protein